MVLSGWDAKRLESPGGWAGTKRLGLGKWIESSLDRWSNFSGQQQRGETQWMQGRKAHGNDGLWWWRLSEGGIRE